MNVGAAASKPAAAGPAPAPAQQPKPTKSHEQATADKRARTRDISRKAQYAHLAATTQAAKAAAQVKATAKRAVASAAGARAPQGVSVSHNGSVKVVTINVRTFRNSSPGSDGKTDKRAFDAITSYINRVNPDVVMMQELDNGTDRSNHRNEIEDFARAVHANDYQFAKAIEHGGGQYGIGIVTRNGHHIEKNNKGEYRSQRIELPKGSGEGADPEQRVALVAPIMTPSGKEFTAVATHATQKGPGRGAQIDKLRSVVEDVRDGARSSQAGLAADLPTTVVVGGDFNTSRDKVEDHIGSDVRHVGSDVSDLGDTKIDHIFVSPDVKVTDAQLDASPRIGWRMLHVGPFATIPAPIDATDHPALQATLELP